MDVLDELISRERFFHHPDFGATRADHDALIAEDFIEVGASGRRYNRDQINEILDQRWQAPHTSDWNPTDFLCRELAPDLYLLTYTLPQTDRLTRRTTIWRSTTVGWKMLFHQGTVVTDG